MIDASLNDLVSCNGIDGTTGTYALDPVPLAVLADNARRHLSIPETPQPDPTRGDSFSTMPVMSEVAEMGWGVIFARDVPAGVREALRPLLARREDQAGRLFKVLDFDASLDTFQTWLARHGVAPGDRDETKIPFYLLLVGSPAAIPFEFQYLLDIEYAVGRVAFDTAAEYEAYARAVVDYERAQVRLAEREVVYWGPRHEGDSATELSADCLLDPLANGGGAARTVAETRRFRSSQRIAAGGTKEHLLDALHRDRQRLPPAVLFTASHGLSWPKHHARHATDQGALLCQGWERFTPVQPEHCVSGADVGDDARVHGLVAFSFACFSAGTPAVDNFRRHRADPPAPLADRPFISALPRRLLAHPNGGALAVIGHVDRAWGFSIRPPGIGARVQPFRTSLNLIMHGLPVGLATTDFSQRYATLCANLLTRLDALDGSRGPMSDRELAIAWIERNDAQNYVLLGDPAARLRPEVLA
ncbi:hypothetical protein [Sorangium sp. So ce1389]|uniref:hypothetical protein n=1 Tax=Sorangium sp. So ce1389 TaxID=3133336 RepID=UPI003F613074